MAKRPHKKKRASGKRSEAAVSSQEVVEAKAFVLDWKLIAQAGLIILAGLWVFSPALRGNWLWDDGWYVAGNPLLNSVDGLKKLWFSPGSWVEYYPIEETVLWVQWHLWHNDTLGYHLTTLFLHLANALMVWKLLSKVGLRFGWLGGLLFAIHPVQAESVAYMVELKNTLSLQPFLWAMCFWIDYETGRRPRDYLCALGLFLVAMLCKVSMAPFPIVILLYAWWKHGRIGWSDLKASAPFFLLALVLGEMTILAGIWYRPVVTHISPDQVVPLGGILSRLACAGLNLSFYLWNFFWSVGLVPIYPHWSVDPPSLIQFLPWPIFGAIAYFCWRYRATWGRHVLFGLGFFVLMLAPFLGFIEVSYMNFTWVMDHFLYLPCIGLIALLMAGLEQVDIRASRSVRLGGVGLIALVLIAMGYTGHLYAGAFLSDATLWNYTLKSNPGAWPARNNLGVDFKQAGKLDEALVQYGEALKIRPDYASAYNNIGDTYLALGELPQAREYLEHALQLDPDYAEAHNNLANVLAQMNQLAEAKKHYEEAVRISPRFALAQNNLGKLHMQMGETLDAIKQYKAALAIDPQFADAHFDLGNAFQANGQFQAAKEQYDKALTINPRFLEAYNNLGAALNNLGQLEEAANVLNAVLQLNPRFADAHNNLGAVFFRQGRMNEAIAEFEKALQFRPDSADAKNNLAKARASAANQVPRKKVMP